MVILFSVFHFHLQFFFSVSKNIVLSYERGMLQQREADLKNQFEKFNTIGARELEAQSREQETRLPLQFRAHAQMQYKQHIYAAKEIKNLLDRL